MNNLSSLLCGYNNRCEGTAKVALGQLSSSIEGFASKANNFLREDVSNEMLSFGPFCARVLLENSYAAIVGRLDPFRMLYLSEFQAQPEYEHGKRARSAFAWTGDVMQDDKPTQALWSPDHDLPKISRALFSKYLEHIYWKPAVERMLDFVSTIPAEPTLAEVLLIDAEVYIGETRGKSAQLYSTLSKAVHWEFFTSALLFDELTVKTSIRETFLLVSKLGLISHFVPTAYASLKPDEAVEHYISFRKLVP
ncbi:hypothetical protein [Undibacterium sp.]|uniref:hypothetical protein n=1 Tax=Undibacterium sp. TaxID=1914977 RepID=UPI00272EE976|nr:hypothetical protein [Undibacterium sp.]MDP1978710.1 hypothetical protein [Undibacterium sp.]